MPKHNALILFVFFKRWYVFVKIADSIYRKTNHLEFLAQIQYLAAVTSLVNRYF